jgi:cobalamin biosynthesis protein CobD/CbiB
MISLPIIWLGDHDLLLLLLFGLAIDALFGDLPAVFAYVPHPVVLAGHAIGCGT